jgi:hypothetical protein
MPARHKYHKIEAMTHVLKTPVLLAAEQESLNTSE